MTDAPADPSDPEPLTVLEALGAKLGAAPKLSLKDETSGHGPSPVLKPASDEIREALPKGRGNYQLLGELARGGMGVVFKGHDTDLGRDVALKVLHEELAQDPVIVSRFVEEAQIGGQLQHPGIVPVYELGLMADDRPFFTMKLVKGRTLSVLLKQRRELTQDRRRFLTIFEQVCQTIAYAHSRDVIHRDLKPSNVMLGAFGEVQVVDWGLAKVLSRSGDGREAHTRATRISTIETVRSGSSTTASDSVAGAVMGTPAYMPPEQARGELEDLGQTADVFALGGLLCQILTGEPPYPGSRDHALALAESGDQTELSERLSQCGADRDLVDLTRQCLAPAPVDRPENAGEVAERIHAHLASLEDRARRAEVRAARTLALSASVIVTLTVAGGAWLWVSGERADRRQNELAQEADRRRETEGRVYTALSEATFSRGQKDWRNAGAAVERAREFLAKEPDADLEKSVDREAERQARAKSLAAEEDERADRLAQFLDGMERNRGDLWVVTNAQYRLDAYEQAFEEFGIDLTFLEEEEVVGASVESGRPADIALALVDLARFHWIVVSGKSPRLIGFANAMDPDPLRIAVRGAFLTSDEDQLLELAGEVEAGGLNPLTSLVMVNALKSTVVALPSMDVKALAIRILEQTARRHPTDASVHILLGELLLDRDPKEARLYLSVARGLRPESPYVLQLLGRVHRELGEIREATRFLRRAVALHVGEPQNHIHLGLALRAEGDEQGAIDSFRTASESVAGCLEDYLRAQVQTSAQLFNKSLFDQSAWYARRAIEMDENDERGYLGLGRALNSGGLPDEAIRNFRRVIELNPNHPQANNVLGIALKDKGLYGQAIESYRRQIEINPNHIYSHINLGNTLSDNGRFEEAIQSYRTQLEIKLSAIHARAGIATVLYRQGHYEKALEEYKLAEELDTEWCEILRLLSSFLAHVPDAEFHDAAEAVHLAEKAVDQHVDYRMHDSNHSLPLDLRVLGQAYYRANRFEECVHALTRTIGLSTDGADASDCFFLAMAHQMLGDPREASKWFDAGVEWMDGNQMSVPDETDFTRWRGEARRVLDE